jgi:hypothetical protein
MIDLSEKPLCTIPHIMCWVSVKDGMPTKDGQYCTYLQTGKYDSIGFTQFLDGELVQLVTKKIWADFQPT